MRLRLWLLGLLAALIGLTVVLYAPLVGIAVIAAWALIALVRPRFAGAAGLLIGLGAIAVVGWYQGRQKCLDMGPSCEFGNNDAQLFLAWAVLVGGLALTVSVFRPRPTPPR